MSNIVLAGSSGILGTALTKSLELQGHQVIRLVRRPANGPNELTWNPTTGTIAPDALTNCDAVVNLAGESISSRWTNPRKKRIVESRILSTQCLAEQCARSNVPVLINASAIGIYGNRADEILDETSPPGVGFLTDTCMGWEHALDPARSGGVRTVSCRFGMILAPKGGALARLKPLFDFGLGGPLGTGLQWVSWIHLADAVGAVEHLLAQNATEGAVVVTSPNPVRQAQFAKTLANRLHRPSWIRTSAWILRLFAGQMADELLLTSQRCHPAKLCATDFVWKFPELDLAFQDLLNRQGLSGKDGSMISVPLE